MSFTENLMNRVDKRLALIPQDRVQYAWTLEKNWFDSYQSIRECKREDLERIGIPSNIVTAILDELQVMGKYYRARENKNAMKRGANDANASKSSSSEPVETRSRRLKRLKTETGGVEQVNVVQDRIRFVRTETKEALKAFQEVEIDATMKKESMRFLADVLIRIRDHPELTYHRSIDIEKPENWEKLFQFAALVKILDLIGFEKQNKSRMFLADKLPFKPLVAAVVEILEVHLRFMDNPQVEELSDSEAPKGGDEIISVLEESMDGSVRTACSNPEEKPDRELENKLEEFHTRVFPKFRYKIQPVMHLCRQNETPFPLEHGGHAFNPPVFEQEFGRIRGEFEVFRQKVAATDPDLSGPLGSRVQKLWYLLANQYLHVTLRLNNTEWVELKLSKYESLRHLFLLVKKHVVKSEQRFYLSDPITQWHGDIEDGAMAIPLGAQWNEDKVCLRLITGVKEPPEGFHHRAAPDVQVISF